jgi:hypothetical protein
MLRSFMVVLLRLGRVRRHGLNQESLDRVHLHFQTFRAGFRYGNPPAIAGFMRALVAGGGAVVNSPASERNKNDQRII